MIQQLLTESKQANQELLKYLVRKVMRLPELPKEETVQKLDNLFAPVTQWIEYRISNPAVAGSSPARRVRKVYYERKENHI